MKHLTLLLFTFFYSIIITKGQPTINPCAQATSIHIVVIGSSTAAGSGPSTPDSAWVNRYRNYLQEINPSNQVTNLAIGGTTTYHIMPTWFIAPSGRPATNPSNNVSQAITLNADAIIVNMPSNDAANGFGINEQMANFITIKNTADSANIPVWICTTQPRTFGATQDSIQIGVRDSILNQFGSFAIDFWNGCANTSNDILPTYDSGDGVHMNNAGHRILNDRVISAEIPNIIADTLAYTDHILTELYIENTSVCGDSNTTVNAVITNLGPNSSNTVGINFEIFDNNLASTNNTIINTTSPLNACVSDTISLDINSYNGVNLDILSYIINTEIDNTNDTSNTTNLYTKGHPNISSNNDTACFGDNTVLIASGISNSDTTIWYSSLSGGNIVAYGDSLFLNNVSNSQTYFCESVRGNLFFEESLFTTSTTTTNWNGIMFDIVALDTITVDSLMIKINSTGQQGVVAYKRAGSHFGNEMISGAWSLWGIDTVQVNNSGDFKILNYPDETLYPNDTLGVYLHMETSSSRLSYQFVSTTSTISNNELEIASGTGISYTYGTTYYPRNFSGEVFYHHGFNPSGDCSSDRIAVNLEVLNDTINLGPDTILGISESILLNNNLNFSSYLWSNNSTNSQLLVDTTNFNLGLNSIWVEATNSFGCTTTDTIIVTFSDFTDIKELSIANIIIAPNPTNGTININLGQNEINNAYVHVIDLFGKTIFSEQVTSQEITLNLTNYSKGIYLVKFSNNNGSKVYKVIKE
jgi:lysophospholipase L1-like esterase